MPPPDPDPGPAPAPQLSAWGFMWRLALVYAVGLYVAATLMQIGGLWRQAHELYRRCLASGC